jgi:C-terminal processing protease CtpA/Prc
LASLFFSGTLRGQRDRAHVSKPYREVFDSVLVHIERSFYTPDLNGVKVPALRGRYRESAGASRTDGEFLSVMRRMLGEFRASHLEFFAISSVGGKSDEAGGPTEGISWRQLTPSVGYLRIDSFENGARAVARVDSALAALNHNAAIVIDLRDNAGGSLSAAMRLGDYILPQQQPVGYFVSREGLTRHRVHSIDQLKPSVLPVFSGYDSDDFAREMATKGALMLVTGARAERAYRGRVVVLIDEHSFSASEALASVVKETRVATLIGRRTSGSMLSATTLNAGGGWTLLLPVWDFRTARGVRVEGKGVEPDIEVKHENDDISTALKFLNESRVKP